MFIHIFKLERRPIRPRNRTRTRAAPSGVRRLTTQTDPGPTRHNLDPPLAVESYNEVGVATAEVTETAE